jgi:hypothetical protein
MMSDYFDQFELALTEAVGRRAHLRWYARWRVPIRSRGLTIVIVSLVVAAPAVAAVGALSGWFSAGKPDVFYPASPSTGLGRTIPGTRMLPIREADPAGGPPWGLRLVRTDRGDTCLQVGRVEDGEIGSLGIDYSWGNDHKFHPINRNDGAADVCGATDAAGHGFVNSSRHGWAASAFIPSDYGRGKAASYCRGGNPERAGSRVPVCPAGSLRMIFVGLLGPDAKSITYRTPSGATKTEQTVGGVGAYLIVFKQTATGCRILIGEGNDCAANYEFTDNAALRSPTAVTSVTYKDGRTCSLPARSSFAAMVPQCPLVGWVPVKEPKLTTAQVASPIRFKVVKARQYCYSGPLGMAYKGQVFGCDGGVPKGDHRYYVTPPGKYRPEVLVTASFTARQPVSTTNSWYAWYIDSPGNTGGGGNRTQTNIRRGQRVKFWMFEEGNQHGTYRGTVTFMQNAGQNGPEGSDNGPLTVGRFSFTLR